MLRTVIKPGDKVHITFAFSYLDKGGTRGWRAEVAAVHPRSDVERMRLELRNNIEPEEATFMRKQYPAGQNLGRYGHWIVENTSLTSDRGLHGEASPMIVDSNNRRGYFSWRIDVVEPDPEFTGFELEI